MPSRTAGSRPGCYKLKYAAEYAADTTRWQIEARKFKNFVPQDGPDLREVIFLLDSLPKPVTDVELYKSFLMGWHCVIDAFRFVLVEGDVLPTEANALAAVQSEHYDQRHVSHFFAKGGRVRDVFNSLLWYAEENEGNYIVEELWEESEDTTSSQRCRASTRTTTWCGACSPSTRGRKKSSRRARGASVCAVKTIVHRRP